MSVIRILRYGKPVCQFVDGESMPRIVLVRDETTGPDEPVKQRYVVRNESMVILVPVKEGTEVHAGDDDRPFEFAAVVFGGKIVFFLSDAGSRGVESALQAVLITDLTTPGSMGSRHGTSFARLRRETLNPNAKLGNPKLAKPKIPKQIRK